MTNLETKIKEWLEDEIQSSREVIAEYTDNHRPKCDDGSDDLICMIKKISLCYTIIIMGRS